ncbi:MAG TPA: NAD(P)-binding domain-containing protein [Dermatophilaceae bacterium]|nr:NAD(P)-binding domain-containing protein [Dermatophilaceae bacterium]
MSVRSVGIVGHGPTSRDFARRLLQAGLAVTVCDTGTARGVDALGWGGARRVRLPADAAEGADLVFAHLPDEAQAEEALFDHGGIGETLADGGYVIDASDVGPAFSRSAAKRCEALGLHRVELAVVAGATPSVERPRLLAAGAKPHVTAVRPALELLSPDVRRLGSTGSVAGFRLMAAVLDLEIAALVDVLQLAIPGKRSRLRRLVVDWEAQAGPERDAMLVPDRQPAAALS